MPALTPATARRVLALHMATAAPTRRLHRRAAWRVWLVDALVIALLIVGGAAGWSFMP